MNQSKKITDGALLTAIFVVLMLLWWYFSFFSVITVFLLPIPFIIFSYRYDWKPSLLMFVAAAVITMLFATVISIPITLLAAAGGIMIGTAMHHRASPYEAWARGTVGFVIGMLFSFLFSQIVFQINFTAEFDNMIQQSMQMSRDMMQQLGVEDQIEGQIELLEQQFLMVKNLIPVMFVVMSMLFALVSQWLSYKLINRIEKKTYQFPPFRMLRFPVAIVWIYFVAMIVSFFQPDPNGILFLGVQNVLMLAGFFMVIQGLSFVFFYAHEKKLTKAIPILLIVFIVIIPFILLPLVRILGIIDIGFRLRERVSKK
ncbi:YybS family protein [Virgibacillus sp. LDC-1]|uniref:YybS family protein n=1 Tax=Virgibacillus sp. LDC-1 TaxID=3039856 RepID=UPI0024DE2A20|nr:YybS family protein [Virgibacillus sp. LDC-1]